MRVISGEAKGQRLKVPKGQSVRPTTDRIKESVFNSLQNYIAESCVVDLFSGSGSLGIEALSRNAKQVYFVEMSNTHANCIQKNLEKTRFTEKAVIVQRDIKAGIKWLNCHKITADLIFMDPPYDQNLVEETIYFLSNHDIMKNQGILVVEHSCTERIPEIIGKYKCIKQKKYGNTCVTYFEKGEYQ